jgi:hypothetical protein
VEEWGIYDRVGRNVWKFSHKPFCREGYGMGILYSELNPSPTVETTARHLDDCYLILKTLVDPSLSNAKTRFADQYVIDSKLPGAQAFMQSIADYKTSLGTFFG